MKSVKIYGSGCAKCRETEAAVRRAVAELGTEATVEKIEDMQAIVQAGIMLTPAVSVDGVVKVAGRVPRDEEIKGWLSP